MVTPTKFITDYLNYPWNKLKEVKVKLNITSFNKPKYYKASFHLHESTLKLHFFKEGKFS